uniref:GIY-YIG protein n=1 Tax=Rhizophagus irregularis TaxID=588596 RepID=A0A140GAX6_9GLOM|nr:GIY-YIG protein [Rhizophagus irregularis]
MAGYFSLCGATGIILNALVKYGINSFTLVLFIIPNANKEGVLKLEQFVLDTWKPEYNIQLNAISSAGRILSVEHKNKIAFAREGSIHTEETKAKIAASLTGDRSPRFNKGTPYTFTRFILPNWNSVLLSLIDLELLPQPFLIVSKIKLFFK